MSLKCEPASEPTGYAAAEKDLRARGAPAETGECNVVKAGYNDLQAVNNVLEAVDNEVEAV